MNPTTPQRNTRTSSVRTPATRENLTNRQCHDQTHNPDDTEQPLDIEWDAQNYSPPDSPTPHTHDLPPTMITGNTYITTVNQQQAVEPGHLKPVTTATRYCTGCRHTRPVDCFTMNTDPDTHGQNTHD